jgi:hypothetical protein
MLDLACDALRRYAAAAFESAGADIHRRLLMLRRSVQAAGYAVLDVRERRRLRSGVTVVATALEPASAVRHVTSVTRLPSWLAAAATSVVEGLPGVAGHYVYPQPDVHLTLLNLDRSAYPNRVQLAREALTGAAVCSVELRGLATPSHSVYAKVYDSSGALAALRGRIAGATGCRPSLAARWLGFVNLVRFTSQDVAELVDAVRAMHRAPLGTLEIRHIEIVETDKVLSQHATTVLQRIDLADDAWGR